MFLSGGIPAGAMYCVNDDCIMYDIQRDTWSAMPERWHEGANHSSVCLNGKLYIFFGSHGGMCGVNVPQATIERFDARAFIAGKRGVQWEKVALPPE